MNGSSPRGYTWATVQTRGGTAPALLLGGRAVAGMGPLDERTIGATASGRGSTVLILSVVSAPPART